MDGGNPRRGGRGHFRGPGNNHGNRGGQHRNRDGHRPNRGGHPQNRGGHPQNRGGHPQNRGGQNQNYQLAGLHRNLQNNARAASLQEMDWFNMQPIRRNSIGQAFNANDLPIRNNYGGRYNQMRDNNEDTRSEAGASERGNRPRRPRGNFMGFKKLEEIYEKEPEQVIIALSSEETGLDKLFQTDLSDDYIVLIIRVASKACESTFKENKAKLLAKICEQTFMNKLLTYLSHLILHDRQDKIRNKFFWEHIEQFWTDLLNFYENVIQLIPNSASEVLPKIIKITCATICNLESMENITISDAIKAKLEDIQYKLMLCVEEREKKKAPKEHFSQNEEPPDDFRQISLYPMINEITDNREKVFLRPNIINGSYQSVDHYLDIHFRLLREDFIAPLRDGICQYLSQQLDNSRKRIFNVRFYNNVTFIKKTTIQDKVADIIQLNMGKKKIKLENTRRLMFGSLVCFTSNNFQSVIFGTVASRDLKLIQNNQIAIDLIGENLDNKATYIMVECSVYFEPYYHVLKALQLMDEDHFPFKRYIIDVQPEVNPPRYYEQFSVIAHNNYNFYALNTDRWPTAEQFGLDTSQYNAFKAALTKEFCVIQGPPGTGKTFIGLKVAQTLLENRELWNANRNPILIICFTNHALDQFLEGISNYTKKLVRIGGQSKNEKLKSFNIKELRNHFARNKSSNRLIFQRRDEIKDYMNKINRIQVSLDGILNCNCIIDVRDFQSIEPRLNNSWFMTAKRSEILDWLMGGRTAEERYLERRQQRMAQLQNQMQAVEINNSENDDDDEDGFYDAEEEEARLVDDTDEYLSALEHINLNSTLLLTHKTLEERIYNLEREIATLTIQAEETNNYVIFDERHQKENELEQARIDFDYFMYRMDQLKTGNIPPCPLIIDFKKPQMLTANERWGFYFYCLNLLKNQLYINLNTLNENYRHVYRQYEEVKQMEDIRLMREMQVIGMTTCGAARYQNLLQALKCSIVIVEEAAEVLESHVIVSLTNDCQHLILIGDHKQLRPTTAEYNLRKNCNLDISLFERMVKNEIHCETLGVQHRMRPEIAKLIVPAIYPKLDNHISVESYPPVRGVTKNLFFITHTEPEEVVDDAGSRKNVHEAKFLIKFARHLILQGYEPEDITILAAYSGQMFCLWKERKNIPLLKDVRITGVDNYQGEENKIILLSLVRSNAEAIIGFLSTDNRVNVALSRAKEGLYIMGNMDILEKSHNAWPKIKQVLQENEQIGTHLTLRCQVHTAQLTPVKTTSDFLTVPEGGCSLLCGKLLNCGHICESLCHITDRDHTKYLCKERCTKILCEIGHECPDRCFEICKPCMVPMKVTLKCGHSHNIPCHIQDTSTYQCRTLVSVKLDCDHITNKPCFRDIKTFPCPHPCDVRKLCGHACERRCHTKDDPDHLMSKCFKSCGRKNKNCSTNEHSCQRLCYEECNECEILVKKVREPCKHVWNIACHKSVDEIKCTRRCKNILPCTHPCRLECHEPCGNCEFMVEKIVASCGHKVRVKCKQTPDRSMCSNKCPLLLPCGHPCSKKCKEPCSQICTYPVDNPHPSACGHKFQIPCYKVKADLDATSDRLLKHCKEPCSEILQCKHKCAGTCGECAQGRIHVSCKEKCGATLICGHACEIPCNETCQPCDKKCSYRCKHSKCGKKCGEPCTTCKERCERRCEHQQCGKLCSEICDIEPCYEPCKKLLRCGHPCIGFCGDPCPRVCRVCNADHDTFTILFGNEDEPDARFVYLEDCKHVIESDAMDHWIQQTPDKDQHKEVNLKCCPKCKTLITLSQRYSNHVKQAFKNVIAIKKKWFLKERESNEKRTELLNSVLTLKTTNVKLYQGSQELHTLLKEIEIQLSEINKGRRNALNTITINNCTVKIQLTEQLVNILNNGKFENNQEFYKTSISKLNFLLKRLIKNESRVSQQKITDLQLEINRFERYIQLYTIENNRNFAQAFSNTDVKNNYLTIMKNLDLVQRYTDIIDTVVKNKLESLRELVDKSMRITEEERKMIVQAVGLGKGRWFTCPNGHYYVIGECGGAMQVSKCGECDAQIGGTQHTLLSTNRFAGEMDGAAHPAWSDAANMDMRNYEFI